MIRSAGGTVSFTQPLMVLVCLSADLSLSASSRVGGGVICEGWLQRHARKQLLFALSIKQMTSINFAVDLACLGPQETIHKPDDNECSLDDVNTTLRNWAQRHKGEVSKRSDVKISFVLNQTNQRSCEGDGNFVLTGRPGSIHRLYMYV